ncbi:MAG: TIGR03936 family radical SAM-associated protein [Clostridia bacterium]|nr:TIGR03936 family radical SAM-associated protein [Clostridia bacterium]
MKMLTVFEKGARLRHIGHLDLMRAMQRALRRSSLPIRYSQGFNPHILMSFAAPLSLGAVGMREVMEVSLEGNVTAEEFSNRLSRALPPDIRLISCRPVDDTHKPPMALLRAARYRIEPRGECSLTQGDLDAFLGKAAIPAVKKTKSGEKEIDIKPMIHELTLKDGKIFCTLDLCEEKSCKPELMLSCLCSSSGVPPMEALVVRLLLLSEKDGAFLPLEDA